MPAPPPGPFSAKSSPGPNREPRGGRGNRAGRPGQPWAPRERPRGARTGAETRLGTRVGGRTSERARGGRGRTGGRCSPIPRSSCCARCPPNPTSSATAVKRHERRPSDHRGREASRAGPGTRDAGADDRPGTAPAPAPAPAAETHGQTRAAAAAAAPAGPPSLPPARTHLRRSATRASREVAGDEEVQLCGEKTGTVSGGRAAPGGGDARPRLTRLDERHRTSGRRRLRHGGARDGRGRAGGTERASRAERLGRAEA